MHKAKSKPLSNLMITHVNKVVTHASYPLSKFALQLLTLFDFDLRNCCISIAVSPISFPRNNLA